jgi:hypothetical protein
MTKATHGPSTDLFFFFKLIFYEWVKFSPLILSFKKKKKKKT